MARLKVVDEVVSEDHQSVRVKCEIIFEAGDEQIKQRHLLPFQLKDGDPEPKLYHYLNVPIAFYDDGREGDLDDFLAKQIDAAKKLYTGGAVKPAITKKKLNYER